MQSDHKCENMEFYSHLKKFRENTLQCTICVDFTEFYGKTVKEHLHYTVWKLRKFYVSTYSVPSLVVQIFVKPFCFSIPKFQNRLPQN